MPKPPSRLRYAAKVVGRAALAFVIVVGVWMAICLVLIINAYVKPDDGLALLVLGGIMLVTAFPWLAADLIVELGPLPPRSYRAPLHLRFRLGRLHRTIVKARARRRHQARAERLARRLDRAATRAALATTAIPSPLDKLTDADLASVIGHSERSTTFGRDYACALDRLHPSNPNPITLDTITLTPASRVLFLGVLLGLGDGRAFDRLDLAASTLTTGQFTFTGSGRAIDLGAWQRQLPIICALLGGRYRLDPADGLRLTLIRSPELPAAFPLDADLLQPGQLFLGRDLDTGAPHHLPFAALTHTLVVGPSGFGKSTFLHQVVLQLAAQPAHVAAVYIVDLKHGLEFAAYANAASHLTVIERYADLPALLAALTALLNTRIAEIKAARLTRWPGAPILVVVDEFAQIMHEPDSKDGRQAVLDGFIRLGNQARAAGIYLWVQVQHAVAETLPTPLRRNLAATIAFRQPSGQAAAQVFGDTSDFPADITKFRRGQFLYRNGLTSELAALQAAHVTHADLGRFIPATEITRS